MSDTFRRSKKAYDGIRKNGGSIFNHKGANMSGSAYGWNRFDRYINELCASDPEMTAAALETIEEAVAEAERMAGYNALRFTNPKCHSRPEVHLHVGCRVEWKMTPRSRDEEDCTEMRG